MKTMALTQGQVALLDDEDYERVSRYKWCASWHKNTRSFRAHGTVNGKNILLSRFIMNADESEVVDHKNRNTLDDRRSNLRRCSRSQNQYNRGKIVTKTSSRFKGVCFDKRRKKWESYIWVEKQRRFLGYFIKEIDAALAYNQAAQEAHGEFARLNAI